MDRFLENLKSRNRTLTELQTGILSLGIAAQILGAILIGTGIFKESAGGEMTQIRYAESLWFGIVTALCGALHMYRTLNVGLSMDTRSAQRKIALGYSVRYAIVAALTVIICLTNALDPLVFFFALLTLKFGAYLQPLTHKFYNALFHEVDPEPISQEEYEAQNVEAK